MQVSAKERAIRLIRSLSWMPLPLAMKVRLVRVHRAFRHLIPPHTQLVERRYLGRYAVNVEAKYPIELELLTGEYEPGTTSIVRRFLRPGDTAMDVGANIGALTILMADVVGTGLVYAVEPGPFLFARLNANLELNLALRSHVHTLQLGLSRTAGTLFWEEDPRVPGNAGLRSDQGIPVPIETIDGLAERLGFRRLDFMKIDVEGMEIDVLHGAVKSLRRLHPVIYYETLAVTGGPILTEIETLLRGLDYALHGVDQHGELHAGKVRGEYMNVLAVPTERQAEYGLVSS